MADPDDKPDRTLPPLGGLSLQLAKQAAEQAAADAAAAKTPAASTPPYPGACHCGAVRFSVTAPITEPAYCGCPHCVSRNIVLASVAQQDFELLCDEQALALYPFHRQMSRHYYCPTCGVYPFLRPREANDKVLVNVFCLDEFDPSSLGPAR